MWGRRSAVIATAFGRAASRALRTAGCAIQDDAAALAYCSSFSNRGPAFSLSTLGVSREPPTGSARVGRLSVCCTHVCISHEPIFRWRVKKGPENPISVVADKAAARGANPAHDRSFWQRGVLACRHALVRLPAGTERECDGGACRAGTRHRAPFVVPGLWSARPRGRPFVRAGRAPGCIDPWLGAGVKPVPSWGGGADLTWRGEVRVDACGPGREASPPCLPAAGGSVPSATVRDPAPGPAGLPLRQDQGARQAPRPRRRGPSSFPVSPQPRAAVRRGQPGGGRT
jgi:hypothetical protein